MAHRLLMPLLLVLLAGCVHLEPYASVEKRVPTRNLVQLQVDDFPLSSADEAASRRTQQVFVEQAGRGDAVILLHGFGGSSYSWRLLTPSLAPHYRTLAPDLSGFGFTERPPGIEPYTRRGQLDLVLALMDHFELSEAHLIGHSYGGALALTLAYQHPERVRSLTLLDPAAPDYPQERRRRLAGSRMLSAFVLRGIGLRRPLIRRALRRSFFDDDLVTEQLIDQYRRRLTIEGAIHAYQGLTAPVSEDQELVPLEEIRIPTLALWGEDDELIPVETARIQVARIPHSQFVVLANVGHVPMEESPARVADEILTFLEGVSEAR